MSDKEAVIKGNTMNLVQVKTLKEIMDEEKQKIDLRHLEIADQLGVLKSRVREIDVYLINIVNDKDVQIHKKLWMIYNDVYKQHGQTKEVLYALYMFGIMMGNLDEGRKL